MSVAENIAKIEERILRACDSAGRKRDEITLMAVSKFVPEKLIKDAYDGGVRFFGESRVKEACEKLAGFRNEHHEAHLHMIGSLQRNKARQAVQFFDCIQSVDRDELICELLKHVSLRETPLSVLLELHTGEETKGGYADLDALFKAAQVILSGANLKLAGLMTMAPFTGDEKIVRSSFRQLVNAKKEMEKRFPLAENFILSMGMSNDFEIAIEEGSSMLRIGSAIFKE